MKVPLLLRGTALLPLLAGAPGCGGSSGGGGVIAPPAVTLAEVQSRVFSPRCAVSGCHAGSGAPFGLNLNAGASAANLINIPSGEQPALLRVEPFDAADSYLYMKVIGDPRISGDQMPASGPLLNAAELELIADWINAGAQ